jgi:hypothetical protein
MNDHVQLAGDARVAGETDPRTVSNEAVVYGVTTRENLPQELANEIFTKVPFRTVVVLTTNQMFNMAVSLEEGAGLVRVERQQSPEKRLGLFCQCRVFRVITVTHESLS